MVAVQPGAELLIVDLFAEAHVDVPPLAGGHGPAVSRHGWHPGAPNPRPLSSIMSIVLLVAYRRRPMRDDA
ncbi:hypothetical protein MSEO_03380 [Mycobacterium seoulense]|uniref:Uncharacterized protein n=1 Tax=Mycobacterium seoulense TaxID=386911 RepID=A0A7I7NTU0_9MYCO|nr:hypothetical protein MSEO_03380 [Mycobacterium seoulense]